MISNRKMKKVKRIAFAAGDYNRKALIEWSYYNQEVLKQHELIAPGLVADILEGTVGVQVLRLPDSATAANQELSAMIAAQQIDMVFFFWDPSQRLPVENGLRVLQDKAVLNNVIIAANLATADFLLASALMDQPHTVPVLPGFLYQSTPAGQFSAAARRAMPKVNTIH